ncbi:ribonuclease T2 family protein [Azospirillum sp. ST 5-10]|uniref:ribonuclease T2 family protein n=1 Tax=unclassified Azospirillum TaxID=2630922 RepID=UPI003F4A7D91
MVGTRVARLCGASMILLAAAGAAAAERCPKPPLPAMEGRWALAVNWQAGFCQTFGRNRTLPAECPEASRLDRFTLHGLWPQWQEYCVDTLPAETLAAAPALAHAPCRVRWSELPELPLPAALRESLAAAMPGVRSRLDRHEYVKHGTCSGMPPGEYFTVAIALLESLNATALPRFVAANQGREVTFRRFCEAVGEALGGAAAAAVEADSKRFRGPDGKQRHYLTELRFWLRPVDGRLALAADNFVPVPAGARTLGPERADPLCDDHLDDRTLYIDRLGMEE